MSHDPRCTIASVSPARARWIPTALEFVVGVLPTAVIGGFYAALGIFFGVFSTIVSISERSFSGFIFWATVLALGVGGLTGILGLFLLIVLSERGGSAALRKATLAATAIGVVTAVTAFVLGTRENGFSWLLAYLLAAPIVVAAHYAFRELSRSGVTRRRSTEAPT